MATFGDVNLFLQKGITGESKGGHRPPPLSMDQNVLNFMQFLRKIWQICMLAPLLRGILDPPLGITPLWYTIAFIPVRIQLSILLQGI